ncbi:hypothetical protein MBLNU457_6291t1 [Dothideomycetes sp. NU457]
MAVVVEQTIPFPAQSLDLENPDRWDALFPLIRPTVKAVQTAKGQAILIDTAHADGKHVCVVAVGVLGNLSSKLLSDRHVSAVVTSQRGAGVLTSKDIAHTVENAGFRNVPGFVVVRSGKQRQVELEGSSIVDVEVDGDLELDHVLHLLGSASESCRQSVHQTAELVKMFVKTASTAHSTFHTNKAEGNPAVFHAQGPAGFEKAEHAVERDLKHVMRAHTAQSEKVTYSVHYSDVNGLSRLENYILGLEIAKYFESQNVPYSLSTSTLLQHDKLARGFSISICPIPQSILAPQPQPDAPLQPSTSHDNANKPSTATAIMTFADETVRSRIEKACNAVMKEEPTITRYDEIVGDGDCGYTLRDGAKQVLQFISSADLSALPATVADLVTDLEVNMGGTSGALYCIFLTALSASLATEKTVPDALQAAMEQLLKYTRARLGDRTMLDCLIPFVETLRESGGDAEKAIEEARKGVEGTKTMQAKLGRSTYLDESATMGVPDPGAYGLLVLLQGMCGV